MHEYKRAERENEVSRDLATVTRQGIAARWWSIDDTAVLLGRMSRTEVNTLITEGAFKTVKRGRRRLIVGSSLAQYMTLTEALAEGSNAMADAA